MLCEHSVSLWFLFIFGLRTLGDSRDSEEERIGYLRDVRRVCAAAGGDHAGGERHEGDKGDDGFHVVVWLGVRLWEACFRVEEGRNRLGGLGCVYIGGSQQY